jgi:K+/H+ antiporter YhaU regulatory subunit KhtT
VAGVVRNGNLHTNPGPDFRFAEGDMAAIIGNPEQFNALQKLADGSSRN